MNALRKSNKPAGRWRRRLLPVVVLGLAVAVAAGLVATKPEQPPVEVAERLWLVEVETVRAGRFAPTLSLFGRVESRWSGPLTAGLTADVVETLVVEGEGVESGQVLLRLDDRDARLLLAQREAELAQADARIAAEMRRHQADLEALPREAQLLALVRSEVERLRDLVKNKVGAQSQLDTARQAVERQAIALALRQQAVDEHAPRLAELEAARSRAEALRDQAALELERCTVRAPYDGRIAEVLVAPGQRVRSGDALVELYSTGNLFVRAQLPSRHLPVVRSALVNGDRLVASALLDGKRIQARLRGLAADAVDATGGVDGLFDLVDGSGQVLDQGRFVRLEMVLPEIDDLVMLPFEAVYGADRVFRVDDDNRMRGLRVERVGEIVGSDGKTRLLVRAPEFQQPVRIVTTQLPNAVEGLLVRTTDAG